MADVCLRWPGQTSRATFFSNIICAKGVLTPLENAGPCLKTFVCLHQPKGAKGEQFQGHSTFWYPSWVPSASFVLGVLPRQVGFGSTSWTDGTPFFLESRVSHASSSSFPGVGMAKLRQESQNKQLVIESEQSGPSDHQLALFQCPAVNLHWMVSSNWLGFLCSVGIVSFSLLCCSIFAIVRKFKQGGAAMFQPYCLNTLLLTHSLGSWTLV